MKLWKLCLGVALFSNMLGSPSEAALVYTRDGRVFDGALKVEPSGLVLVMAESRSLMIPYEQIAGISFDGQPLFPAPRRAEESKLLNHDGLIWALVAAQVLATVTAFVTLLKPEPNSRGPSTP
ncbi:MAG: hypothetical protein VKN33_03375 [Candidatus Sericytochromatia bacterium]|nr:hypothetical protein [Candidatus Sericytochromatia bacterium]